MTVVLVGAFGAAGAMSRYAIGSRSFPWATLGVNVAGSLLLGLLLGASRQHGWDDAVVVPLSVGFLGAFTTFSTFSYEGYTLLRTGRAGAALLYVGLSLLLGLGAAAGAYSLGRHVL